MCLPGAGRLGGFARCSYGTGFLVGPDLVMTCDHDVARLAEQGAPPGIKFLFDYKMAQAGQFGKKKGNSP